MAGAGLRWLFSDGNCAAAVTQVFNDLGRIDSVVDWQVMGMQTWRNTAEDPDRMRRRMAEFLVYEEVPVGCLVGIAVRSQCVKEQVEDMLSAHATALPVRVEPGWYF